MLLILKQTVNKLSVLAQFVDFELQPFLLVNQLPQPVRYVLVQVFQMFFVIAHSSAAHTLRFHHGNIHLSLQRE